MYKAGQCWERGRLVRIRLDARFPDIDNKRLRASRSVRTGRPRSQQPIDRTLGQSPPGHGGRSLLVETHLTYVWDVGNRTLETRRGLSACFDLKILFCFDVTWSGRGTRLHETKTSVFRMVSLVRSKASGIS